VPATDWLLEIATDAAGFICTDARLAPDAEPPLGSALLAGVSSQLIGS
jgi:hypothetical protein